MEARPATVIQKERAENSMEPSHFEHGIKQSTGLPEPTTNFKTLFHSADQERKLPPQIQMIKAAMQSAPD